MRLQAGASGFQFVFAAFPKVSNTMLRLDRSVRHFNIACWTSLV